MANEIQASIRLSAKNGLFEMPPYAKNNIKVDQAAVGHHYGTQIVGTTAEELIVGDVIAPGIMTIRSLEDPDASTPNILSYGPATDSAGTVMQVLGKILPGDPPHLLRMGDGVVFLVVFDNDPGQIEVNVLET